MVGLVGVSLEGFPAPWARELVSGRRFQVLYLAVALKLSSLSLHGQINVGIEVLCYTKSMFSVSYLGVHCSFLNQLLPTVSASRLRATQPLGKRAGQLGLISWLC